MITDTAVLGAGISKVVYPAQLHAQVLLLVGLQQAELQAQCMAWAEIPLPLQPELMLDTIRGIAPAQVTLQTDTPVISTGQAASSWADARAPALLQSLSGLGINPKLQVALGLTVSI